MFNRGVKINKIKIIMAPLNSVIELPLFLLLLGLVF
jgi:hypothetical protein